MFYEYTNEICMSASSSGGSEEATQDGAEIKLGAQYVPAEELKKRENIQYQYCKQTISANMPIVYDYVDFCADIERVLDRRTNFEQNVIWVNFVEGRVEALDYMIKVYGCPDNCKSMNDLDLRLDEILYELENDLKKIKYIKNKSST